jgi:hypothetical protein
VACIATSGGLSFYVAGLAKRHLCGIVGGFGAVAILAFYVVHQMEAVIEVDEIGELENARGWDLRIPRDLGVAQRALGHGRVADLRAELRRRGVAIRARQLGSRDVRGVTEGREECEEQE